MITVLYEEIMLQIKKSFDLIFITLQNCFIKENH